MTYFIAAPLLYKEVVVNNLSSFFLGVDDSVQPHHQACITHPTTQSRLCHLIKRKDGTAYNCPRHKSHNDASITSPTAPTTFAVLHKQELLAKVEALHFVYATADKYIYTGLCASGNQGGIHQDFFLKKCDTRRYNGVPKCTKDLPSEKTPLVNLKRSTVGRWLDDTWNKNTCSTSVQWGDHDGSDIAIAMGKFEYHTSTDIPQIAPRFICRSTRGGPLNGYPYLSDSIEINTLHNPNYLNYGENLAVSALNIVHIGDDFRPGKMTFGRRVGWIVDSLIAAFEDWSEYLDTDSVHVTFVRFVFQRFDVDSSDEDTDNSEDSEDEDSDNDEEYKDKRLLAIWSAFKWELDRAVIDPDLELETCWDVCWADEEGDCPACQPDTCHPAYKTGLLYHEGFEGRVRLGAQGFRERSRWPLTRLAARTRGLLRRSGKGCIQAWR